MEVSQFVDELKELKLSLVVKGSNLVLKGHKEKLSPEEVNLIKENKELVNYIKEHKEELIRYLSRSGAEQGVKKRSSSVSAMYSLSPLQEGMLFHGLYDLSSPAYLEQLSCTFSNLQAEPFKASWEYLLQNHTILRTSFHYQELSIPVQCVHQTVHLPFTQLDYSGLTMEKQHTQVEAFLSTDRQRGFDFTRAPLMRLTLIRLSSMAYKMVWTYHHLLLDGWSLPVLLHELLTDYQLRTQGGKPAQREEDRYEEFIRYLESRDERAAEQFWKQYLTGLDGASLLPLPGNRPERINGTRHYGQLELTLNATDTEAVQAYAQTHHLTVNTILQGVWAYLLAKYTGQRDVVYGVTVSGRPVDLAGAEQRVGLYINTLPLRAILNEEQQITEWLTNLQQGHSQAREYSYTPLTSVQGWLGLKGEWFNSLYVFENYPVGEVFSQQWGLQATELRVEEQTNYPLSIVVTAGQLITVHFGYNANLLPDVAVQRMQSHFAHVLQQIVSRPNLCLSDLELVTGEEKRQLLVNFNSTALTYSYDNTVVELFDQQVNRTPEAIALVFEGKTLTYGQLKEKSTKLAHYLYAKGVREETIVPIFADRSLELIIGILGILRAGGAYLPIDPAYPAGRIAYLLKDSSAHLLVTTASHQEMLAQLEKESQISEVVCLNGDWPLIEQQPEGRLSDGRPDQLAYVIYTSGSTGQPKGVMVEHRQVVSLVKDINYVALTQADILLATGSPSFDATTFEYWGMLLNGGQLVLCRHTVLLDNEMLKEEIRRRKVNMMWFTAGWFNQLADTDIEVFEGLKTILVGGDRLSKTHIAQFKNRYPFIEIINGYGPTENTTFSLTYRIDAAQDGEIPIGRPLSNRSAYVLDGNQQLCAIGVAGELYVGGAGLARGYWQQKALTTEQFIAHPFQARERLYRTGDLARWHEDGNLEFVGRLDEQVKIRGYRVEAGEVESWLGQCKGVRQAAVVAREDTTGGKRLVGYVVVEGIFDQEALFTQLKAQLPAYMIPSTIVLLEAMPLTANGKVDKKALPEADPTLSQNNNYQPASTETEARLVQIWQELLRVQQIGVEDNFFLLGGHSLLALRLISAVRQSFRIELPVKTIFTYPTVAGLAVQLQLQEQSALLPPIVPSNHTGKLPLSFAQERLWFIDQLQGSTHYHLPAVLRLAGELDRSALSQAFIRLVERHEVVRTVIKQFDGRAYQEVLKPDWKMDYLADASLANQEAFNRFVQATVEKPFDLSQDAMLRVVLVQLSDTEHRLIVVLHHIAGDGWSVSILVKELLEVYQATLENRLPVLPALPVQYGDYAVWQRDYLKGDVLAKQLAYWKKQLAGLEDFQLPTDFTRPSVQSTEGSMYEIELGHEFRRNLEAFSQREGVTLFMSLLAVFKLLMSRYSDQADICVGTPVAGRLQAEVEPLVGFFVNTLALRSNVSGNSSFRNLLRQVRATVLDAFAHQQLPFEQVVEAVGAARDLSRPPLFQVAFALQNTPEVPGLSLEKLRLVAEPFETTTAKFDLTLTATSSGHGLALSVNYCRDLFEEATIARMMNHYRQLLTGVLAEPDQPVEELTLISDDERLQLLVDFNNTAADYPQGLVLAGLFEAQVDQTPDALAVSFGDRQLTYLQLDEQANQLAHYLVSQGVGTESLVPVCLNRSTELIVSILGILKAGAAYVPVDPAYPPDRIRYALTDTGAKVVITSRAHKALLGEDNTRQVLLIDEYRKENMKNRISFTWQPNHLAYVIYTSGSTGLPKGVLVEHAGIVNLAHWYKQAYQMTAASRSTLLAGVGFDALTWEVWPALLAGAGLFIVGDEQRLSGEALLAFCHSEQITHCYVPTALVAQLVQQPLPDGLALQYVSTGGDQLQPVDVCALPYQLFNNYGPTENTVASSSYRLQAGDYARLPPIGKPIANTQAYVLDRLDRLVPVGVVGELHIGGAQVARGYLNQPELTAKKFIAHPFDHTPGARLYRTGDRVRWRPDGNLEFMGRSDEQVKIRGHRIELGEVESVLAQCPGVQQAVVVTRNDTARGKRLIGYVVVDGTFDQPSVMAWVKAKLPDFMIPAHLVKIPEIPLTVNGKVDKKALPDPDPAQLLSNTYQLPRNETETELVMIWQELLGTEQIGVEDNFFGLGGHSLLAIQLSAKIKQVFLIEDFPIVHVFKNPTISQLAQVIAEAENTANTIQHNHLLLLQPEGYEPPIFIVPGTYGISDAYYELAGAFGKKQPVYGLRMQGVLEGETPLESIKEIAARNLEWIKAVQPKGPYKLLGHSFGGMVVYEMIRQLESQEEQTALAVLLDSIPEIKTNNEEKRNQLAFVIQQVIEAAQTAGQPAINWEQVREDLPVSSFEDLNSYIQNMMQVYGMVIENTGSLERLFRVVFVNLGIAYIPQGKINQKLILVKAQESKWDAYDESLGWAGRAKEVYVTTAPGSHHSMIKGENARHLVDEIRKAHGAAKERLPAVKALPEHLFQE